MKVDTGEVLEVGLNLLNEWRRFLEKQAFSHEDPDSAWKFIPEEWKDALKSTSSSNLAGMCIGVVPPNCPASLQVFIEATQKAQLDATPTPELLDSIANSPRVAEAHWLQASAKKRAEIEA